MEDMEDEEGPAKISEVDEEAGSIRQFASMKIVDQRLDSSTESMPEDVSESDYHTNHA